MRMPVVGLAICANAPVEVGAIVDAIRYSNQHKPWLGCPSVILTPRDPQVLAHTEEGIFAEGMRQAEEVLVLLPGAALGIGLVSWRMAQAECTITFAAFAVKVCGKPRTVAFGTAQEHYGHICRLARFMYSRDIDLPPIFLLDDRDRLDKILHGYTLQSAILGDE